MALVVTTVTPELRLTPFTGVSETVRERSGIARAEAVYSSVGTWPATGTGDNRCISFNFSLDPDYGYVLMDANACFIRNASENRMEATGALEITTDTGPGASQVESQWYSYVSHASRQNSTGNSDVGTIDANDWNSLSRVTGDNSLMLFELATKPTALLYPFPGITSIDLTALFAEQEEINILMAYRFYMRFLQYDIVQGYNYVVNSPIMTRG